MLEAVDAYESYGSVLDLGIRPRLESVPVPEKAPAIFWVPHQDDEALGFGSAIKEHKNAGRPVFLVLVSDGRNGGLASLLSGQPGCSVHNHSFYLDQNHPQVHDYRHKGYTQADIPRLRHLEFDASATTLGVDRVFKLGAGDGINDHLFNHPDNYPLLVDTLSKIMLEFIRRFPNASHKFPSGLLDKGLLPSKEWKTNPTHQAIAEAALKVNEQEPSTSDMLFYRVYAQDHPDDSMRVHPVSLIQNMDSSTHQGKIDALKEYMLFDPDRERFALGFHSVPFLMWKALTEQRNFIDTLDDIRNVLRNGYSHISPPLPPP